MHLVQQRQERPPPSAAVTIAPIEVQPHHTRRKIEVQAPTQRAKTPQSTSDQTVTQDIYAHAFPETRREAVTGLSRLLKRTGGA